MRIFFAAIFLVALAGCGQNDNHAWLGYAEGDTAFVAAPQAGWVANLRVERGAEVKLGDMLFALDDIAQASARDQAQAQIAQAQGQMGQARAGLELAQKELVRQQGLLRSGATSKQALDQAKSAHDTAAALVAQIDATEQQARATLTGAAYQLSERVVVSRTSGRVQDVFFRPGEYAPAMTPVVSILPPGNVYVRFFVPETEFAHVHLGQKVSIHCDGCARDLTATVSFIAAQEEFTPPVIFSVGNREKLVFKVEARAQGGLALHPGQPVDVRPVGGK
ncbi:MAG TPA: efflux RND transporter periplasmic adaptor subunit [Rhizomicrobium sp.]|jgi:HlyD family secretion protein|nr:efflux RND transporter periplasmic adaptor subunit [Rhizomicrobium sp.]